MFDYQEFVKWLNDNQGVLALIFFILSFLGWILGKLFKFLSKKKLVQSNKEDDSSVSYITSYPNSNFIGRDYEINFALDQLKKNDSKKSGYCFVSGFPAIGKTSFIHQVSQRWVEKQDLNYDSRRSVYISIDEKNLSYLDFIDSLYLLLLVTPENTSVLKETNKEALVISILTNQNFLICIDDIPKQWGCLIDVINLVYTTKSSLIIASLWDYNEILITQRLENNALILSKMNEIDARKLFNNIYTQSNNATDVEIDYICEKLGYLPFVIALVASEARIKQESLGQIKERLDFQDISFISTAYNKKVLGKVFDRSLKSAGDNEILYSINSFLKNDISLELYISLFSKFFELSSENLNKKINLLSSYSLIEIRDGRIATHRLLFQYINQEKANPKEMFLYRDYVSKKLPNEISSYNSWLEIEKDVDLIFYGWNLSIEQKNTNASLNYINCLWKFFRSRGYWIEVIEHLKESLTISHFSKNQNKYKYEVLKYLGLFHNKLGNTKESYKFLVDSLELITQVGEVHDKVFLLGDIGQLLTSQGKFKQAKKYHIQALKLSIQNDFLREHAFNLHQLGRCYSWMGNSELSEFYYLRSLNIKRRIEDIRFLSITERQLASLYLASDDLIKAETNFNKCLKISKSIGDKRNIAICLNELGLIKIKSDDYEAASLNLKESLRINKEIGDKRGVASVFRNQSRLLMQEKDTAQAESKIKDSILQSELINDLPGLAEANEIYGDILEENVESKNKILKCYTEALSLYEKCHMDTNYKLLTNKLKSI